MVRFSSSFITAAAVLLIARGALAENSGVCGEQAKCVAPSISSCIRDQRTVCVLFRPGFPGCAKGWSYAYPDVCDVTDESADTAVPTWPFNRGWAGRICHTVTPGDGEAVTFTLRDETACSGEATDFSEFKDGSLAGVAQCSPAASEMCDVTQYTAAYFASNPTFSTLLPQACKWTINVGSCAVPDMCCSSMDAECLACAAGFSVEDFCAAYPDTDNCPVPGPICPQCMEADCLACQASQTIEEYCAINPDTDGCYTTTVCCDAIEASCEACHAKQTIEDYCETNPSVDGCPKICCMAMEASCLACAAEQTIEEYCSNNPSMDGC